MISVLFVCLGNICRSPMAEGIFQSKLKMHGMENLISCDSAGTEKYHLGSLPDPRSRSVCLENNITLTHKARLFNWNDFHEFDLIIAMDNFNLDYITKLIPENAKARIMRMRDFGILQDSPEVPDPYHGSMDEFYHVFEILDHCTDQLLKSIREEYIKYDQAS